MCGALSRMLAHRVLVRKGRAAMRLREKITIFLLWKSKVGSPVFEDRKESLDRCRRAGRSPRGMGNISCCAQTCRITATTCSGARVQCLTLCEKVFSEREFLSICAATAKKMYADRSVGDKRVFALADETIESIDGDPLGTGAKLWVILGRLHITRRKRAQPTERPAIPRGRHRARYVAQAGTPDGW